MKSKEKILKYIRQTYNVEQEFIFKKFPSYSVLRHPDSHKWFGIIMTVNKQQLGIDDFKDTDIIDLKVEPELIGSLIKKEGYYPAYHMSKEHWITIDINALTNVSEIYTFIDASYLLTK